MPSYARQQPFVAVPNQLCMKIGTGRLCPGEQTAVEGSSDVRWRSVGHRADSKYGRITLATRQFTASRHRSSAVPFLSQT